MKKMILLALVINSINLALAYSDTPSYGSGNNNGNIISDIDPEDRPNPVPPLLDPSAGNDKPKK